MKTKRARRRLRQRQLGCEQLESRQMLAAAGAEFFVAAPRRGPDNANLPVVIDSQPGGEGNQTTPRDGGGNGGDRGRANINGDGRRAPRPTPIQPGPLVPAPLGPAGPSRGIANPQQRNSPSANSSPQSSVATANQALAETPNPILAGNLPPAQAIPAAAGQIQTVAPVFRGPAVLVNGVPAPAPQRPPAVPPDAPVTTVGFEPVSANVGQVAAASTIVDVRADAPQSDAFVNPSDTINEANTRFTSAPLSTTADSASASVVDGTDAPLNRSNASAVDPLFSSLVDFVSGALFDAGTATGLISVAKYFGITFESLDQDDDDESVVADVEALAAEDLYPATDRTDEPADAFFELLGDGGLIDFDDELEEIAEDGEIQDAVAVGDGTFAVLDGAVATRSAEQRIQRLLQRLDRRRDEAQASSTEDGHGADGRVTNGESDSAQNAESRTASGAQSISAALIKSDGSCAKWQALEMATGPGDDRVVNDGAPTAVASEGKTVLTAAG